MEAASRLPMQIINPVVQATPDQNAVIQLDSEEQQLHTWDIPNVA